MTTLTTSFLASWFLIHIAALTWMALEVLRANRK